MCFGKPPKAKTMAPAPAPPPPDPVAEEQDLSEPRRAEDAANFGTSTPNLRVDRSVSSGGVAAGGSGLRM